MYTGANFSQIIAICLYGWVTATERGTTQDLVKVKSNSATSDCLESARL